ncbi:sensor histidine kinase [Streptosporangium sp. NPDC000396]|uniref:sensor histidine kinase n=1 Tax=Streptosporangium sp. NPDC000396 TaxID=3366185 RepID=UPI0036CE8BA0
MRIHTQVDAAKTEAAHAPETRIRRFGLWDGYFAVCYLVTTVLLFTSDGRQEYRAIAIGALTLIVPWYAGLGRGLMIDRAAARRNVVFPVGLFLLFALAAAFDPRGSFALFAVVPMFMMSLPTSPAIVVVLLANLMPVLVVWLHGGDLNSGVVGVLPTSLLGIALSVFIGAWISGMVRQSKERAELIGELRRNRERVARLSHEAGISAERERLAREIHDTLAQSLTSIISLVQAAESQVDDAPDLARSHLGLAGRVARESLAEARGFVTALAPPALRGNSLAQAVRRQADGLASQTGLDVRCSVEGVERPLPMAAGVVLLRAAQEAVANVRKHAREARRVDVLLAYDESTVRLVVRDDGEGFAVRPDQEGFGLHGMRSRVEEIGGVATVGSRPGGGTTVEVTVPAEPAVGEETGG